MLNITVLNNNLKESVYASSSQFPLVILNRIMSFWSKSLQAFPHIHFSLSLHMHMEQFLFHCLAGRLLLRLLLPEGG